MTIRVKDKLKLLAVPALLTMMIANSVIPAEAHNRRYYDNRDYNRNRGGFTQTNPYLSKALIGGGAGAVIGGVLGQDGNRADTAVKGALIGAGAGLGYEYLKRQGTIGGNRW